MNLSFFVWEAKDAKEFVTSHVVLRCYCYYHRAQAIYYGAVCGHKETKRSMNFLHPAEDESCYELNGKKTNSNSFLEGILEGHQ